MTKAYDLELSLAARVLPFFVLTIMTGGLVALAFTGARKGMPPLAILPIFGIVVAWQWWMMLTLAYRVIVHDDGSLEWVALARTLRLRPENILKIGPDRTGNIGFFAVTHSEGKVRFINQITGFHEILALISERNPRVEIRGC